MSCRPARTGPNGGGRAHVRSLAPSSTARQRTLRARIGFESADSSEVGGHAAVKVVRVVVPESLGDGGGSAAEERGQREQSRPVLLWSGARERPLQLAPA